MPLTFYLPCPQLSTSAIGLPSCYLISACLQACSCTCTLLPPHHESAELPSRWMNVPILMTIMVDDYRGGWLSWWMTVVVDEHRGRWLLWWMTIGRWSLWWWWSRYDRCGRGGSIIVDHQCGNNRRSGWQLPWWLSITLVRMTIAVSVYGYCGDGRWPP